MIVNPDRVAWFTQKIFDLPEQISSSCKEVVAITSGFNSRWKELFIMLRFPAKNANTFFLAKKIFDLSQIY